MNKEKLKLQISDANAAYRSGNAIMTDAEFDALVEEFRKNWPDEYDEFRDSLNDSCAGNGKKVKHPNGIIMGSLDKLKNDDSAALSRFLTKYVSGKLSVSAKVDGISARITYKDGNLVQAATRGDGYEGVDITDKIAYVKGVMKSVPYEGEISIRGELVMLKGDCADETTNPRNVCAGIMNRKDWNKTDVSRISFVPYTVLDGNMTKAEQFSFLAAAGFNVAYNVELDCSDVNCDKLTEIAHLEHDYECDGLVLTASSAVNDMTKYRPANAMAFKINELSAVTRILDIDWVGPSKNGMINPVFVVEPVEIAGAIISRASAHNLDIIDSLGVKYGSEVEIVKANDIIPNVVSVLSNPPGAKDIVRPDICPCCGSRLVVDGINLRCMNPDCRDQKIYQVMHFIKKLGVMNASFKTLDKFGIDSYGKLLSFKADMSKKSETKFVDELKTKVFTKSPSDLFCALDIRDVGETLQRKIVDFYGWNVILESAKTGDLSVFANLPAGIGQITLDKFLSAYAANLSIVEKITSDVRYSYVENAVSAVKIVAEKKGSVCFTGKLNTMTRGQASEMAQKAGYEVKSSVTKGLTYLVTNDVGSGSSKNKKAHELGTKVISEDDFVKMVSNVESGVFDL